MSIGSRISANGPCVLSLFIALASFEFLDLPRSPKDLARLRLALLDYSGQGGVFMLVHTPRSRDTNCVESCLTTFQIVARRHGNREKKIGVRSSPEVTDIEAALINIVGFHE